MLLRCARCISRFAHDLPHCPQCGEPAENSAPDPDVVGQDAPAEALPAPAAPKRSRTKATAAAVQDPQAGDTPDPTTEQGEPA